MKKLKVSKILKIKLEYGNLTDVTVISAKTLCFDFKCLRIPTTSAFACLGTTWGGCTGVWNMYRVNMYRDNENRAMSMMSFQYLDFWFWTYFTLFTASSSCVSIAGFERVSADCSDMLLSPFVLFMLFFLIYILYIYIYRILRIFIGYSLLFQFLRP